MNEILVYCGQKNGKLFKSSFDLLGGVQDIANKSKCIVSAVIIGGMDVEKCVDELGFTGAHKVYICKNEALEQYNPEKYLYALDTVCKVAEPHLMVFVSDTAGRELAPRIAYRRQAGIVTDCITLESSGDDNGLVIQKPVYGGKAIAEIQAQPVQVITVRQRCFEPIERDENKKADKINVEISMPETLEHIRLVEFKKEKSEGVKLEDAGVVISGGRGIGGKEGFDEIKKLTGLFSGAVGSSRAAVDSGWVPPSFQVGLTGTIVAPDLYIAIGISGASQHLAGMSGSKCIVAINKDPDAPIFKVAQFGIVEDYKKVLPETINQIQKMFT